MKKLVWVCLVLILCMNRTELAEASVREISSNTAVAKGFSVNQRGVLQEDLDWQEELSGYEFDGIEDILEEVTGEKISFSSVIAQLIQGNIADFLRLFGQYAGDILMGELRTGRSAAWQILLLAVAGAVFTNLAQAFPDGMVSQTGFLVLYMVMAALLLTVLESAADIAVGWQSVIVRLMTAFMPVFFVAVAIQGQITAMGMYEFSQLLIWGTQWFLETFLAGGVKIWMLLRILEGMLPEKVLTRLGKLVGSFLQGMVKTAFGAVIGFQAIQSLLLPYMDTVKSGTLVKLASSLPGVGSSVEAAAKLTLGTAALIRNGIGVAGLLVLILAAWGPLVKLGLLSALYHVLAAALQPIADKRMLEAVEAIGEGIFLLWKAAAAMTLLFAISIGVACACFGRVG